MKINFDDGQFSLSASWLVKLRWLAIFVISIFLFIAKVGFNISFAIIPITIVLFLLVSINILVNLYLKFQHKKNINYPKKSKQVIYIQLLIDVFLFSIILHFSGGIENPFIAIYLLHIVLAGISLPLNESVKITVFTNLLLGSIVILEYLNVIDHYALIGFESDNNYLNIKFIFLTGMVFSMMSFAIVYLTNTITAQLRKNQDQLSSIKEELQEYNQKSNNYILFLLQKIKMRFDILSHGMKNTNGHTTSFLGLLENLKTLIELRLENEMTTEKTDLKNIIFDVFHNFRKTKARGSSTIANNGKFNVVVKDRHTNNTEKEIPLSYSIDKSLNLIQANQHLIKTMLYQVLHNAIKFNTKQGQVYFNAKIQNQKLRFEIYDTGIGINKKDNKNIFNEFHSDTNSKGIINEGIGLGLPLANEIALKHNGKIWIDSKKGKGTKFNIELPVLLNE